METKAPLKILLTDNDTDDCYFFKQALTGFPDPYELTVVNDGEQLMKLLSETKQMHDILFLDLNMPRKNGQECLLEIRQMPNLNALPVIIFSTSYEQDVVNLLYENGAQYFIRKPPEFNQFKKIIHHTLTFVTQEAPAPATRDTFVLTYQNNFSV
jgi:CheY-like chemotaxis protein